MRTRLICSSHLIFSDLFVLTVKCIIFLDVVQYSLVEVHRRFGGTYCLQFQGQKVAKKPHFCLTVSVRSC
jgi:hypothetical protein